MQVWPIQRGAARRGTGCADVTRVLQACLDGETDEVTARRVVTHLDECGDCGLEARLYREIKNSLARQGQPDGRAAARLRCFGESLPHTGPADGRDRIAGG
ncbi:anti-sigma factor family protein [Streptomyces cellulosae]|uniref:anti-sigma factor family protein n=1 Tax=Streptomyces cellulosae TaxID=1968 RepID=UPI00068E086D|nr:zf-HC2 domain-containing protein [Streptomyces cellulosae]